MAPRLFVFVCQTRYSWETLMVIIVSFLPELLEFSEDRHPWESVEEKLHEIRYELLVVYVFRSFVRPSLLPSRLSSSLPLSFCPCLSPSLPVPSPFSLPPQLLSPSLHSCLLAVHLSSSLSRYLTTVVSFFAPAIFPSLPSSFPLSLDPSSFSPFLPPSFPPFLPPLPNSPPAALFPYSTNWPMTFHSLTVYLSGLFLVILLLDNSPYFNSLFRDMMRQMVKQMRAGREWRAASQDGSNTIVFSCWVFKTSSQQQLGFFNFKTGVNEKLTETFGYSSQWSKFRLPTKIIRTLAYTPSWRLV